MESANADKRSRDFKREQRANYVLQEGFLDEEKRKSLSNDIPADNPVSCQDFIAEGIRSGKYKLMDIVENGVSVGWCVYGILPLGEQKEFVLVAAYARGRDNVSEGITPILEGIAAQHNCKSFRVHTMRPGLVKALLKQDFFISEIVVRKEIS